MRCIVVLFGATAAIGSPGWAQSEKPEVAKHIIEAVDTGVALKSAALDCAQIVSKHKGELEEVARWEQVGKKLELVSAGIAATSYALDMKAGNYEAAAQTAGTFGLETAVCAALGELCVPFEAGRSFGSLLNVYIPKLWGDNQTINDRWTDTLIGWTYGSGEPTEKQIRQMIARHRKVLQEIKARASPVAPMCSKLEQGKNSIQDLLTKAKERAAGQLTPTFQSNLGALTTDAVSSARSAGAAASGSVSTLVQGFSSTMQTQALANATRANAARAQATASGVNNVSSVKADQAPSNRTYVCDRWSKSDAAPVNGAPRVGSGYYCSSGHWVP